jgi:hypothetical protein
MGMDRPDKQQALFSFQKQLNRPVPSPLSHPQQVHLSMFFLLSGFIPYLEGAGERISVKRVSIKTFTVKKGIVFLFQKGNTVKKSFNKGCI